MRLLVVALKDSSLISTRLIFAKQNVMVTRISWADLDSVVLVD